MLLHPTDPHANRTWGKGPEMQREDLAGGCAEEPHAAWHVTCLACDFEGPHADTRQEAADRWNANALRVSQSIHKAKIEEIKATGARVLALFDQKAVAA